MDISRLLDDGRYRILTLKKSIGFETTISERLANHTRSVLFSMV